MNLSTYKTLIEKVGLSKLDDANSDTYNIVKEGSNDFTDPSLWNEMLLDADIKEAYEMHVNTLQKLSEENFPVKKKETKSAKKKHKVKHKKDIELIKLVKEDVENNPPVSTKKKATKKASRKKVKAQEKSVVKKVEKKEVKFPVTVKRLSKELQLIKRMIGMDGKTKTINSLTLFHRDLKNILDGNPDRKPVLNDMFARMTNAVSMANEADAGLIPVTLEKDFKQRLLENVANPQPKMKVEYLAGTEEPQKGKK